MSNKIYQVFLSSTYQDLEKERLEVADALAKAGYRVAGMEYFPATDLSQLDYIYRQIDQSDYYVVIIGGRYGSTDESGTSYTEHEYEYAKSIGMPVLAFIHSAPDQLISINVENVPLKMERLTQFRDKLRANRVVKFWDDKSKLVTDVVISVGQSVNLLPGKGWVRGDQAADIEVYKELENARSTIRDYEKRLDIGTDVNFDPNLIGPDDAITVSVKYVYSDGMTHIGEEIQNFNVSISVLYIASYDMILVGSEEYKFSKFAFGLKSEKQDHYTDINVENIVEIRTQLHALGLIDLSGRVGKYGSIVCWNATDKGKRFVANKLAMRK